MIVHCSKCPSITETLIYSETLALWLLQIHHWFKHRAKPPLVTIDGDPFTDRTVHSLCQ